MAAIRVERAAPAALALAAAIVANALVAVLVAHRPAAAVGLIAAGAIAVFVVVRPGAALLAAVVGIIVTADLLDLVASMPRLSVGGLEIELSDLFLAVMLVAAAARDGRSRPRPSLTPIVRSPAFVPWAAFAVVGAYDLARGGYGTMSSVRVFAYCVVVPLVVRSVGSAAELRLLGNAVVVGGSIASFAAVAMLASGRSVTQSDLSTGGIRGLSIGGSFLVAAALLSVLAGVAAGEHVGLRTVAVVLLLSAGVVASGARETWLGLVVALALFVLAAPLRGTLRLALVFALAGALAVGAYAAAPHPPQLQERLASLENRLVSVRSGGQDPSVSVRYDKWRVVWSQARAHPFLGTGFGYPATYTSNIGGDNFVRAYVDDPENTHLWLLARMGLVGFAAWIALNLAVTLQLLRIARARQGAARRAALWGLGILGVVWAGMAFSPVSAFGATLLLYWFAVGLAPAAEGLET